MQIFPVFFLQKSTGLTCPYMTSFRSNSGSEIAPENQQPSPLTYAVDETVELDELEH